MDLREVAALQSAVSEEAKNERVAALISRGLAESQVSKTAVARALGISHASVSHWASGKNRPDVKKAGAIAEALRIDVEELRAAIIDADAPTQAVRVGHSLLPPVPTVTLSASQAVQPWELGPADIPIMGNVVGGEDADFYLSGEQIGTVRRPPAIAGLREVYALHVIGSSMDPRFRDGELVYVHRRTPHIGDDVIVQLKPDDAASSPRGFIKFLVRRTARAVVCGQYNPPLEIEYPASEVLAIDRVIPWAELLSR